LANSSIIKDIITIPPTIFIAVNIKNKFVVPIQGIAFYVTAAATALSPSINDDILAFAFFTPLNIGYSPRSMLIAELMILSEPIKQAPTMKIRT